SFSCIIRSLLVRSKNRLFYFLSPPFSQKPLLVGGQDFRSFLLKYCPIVQEKYYPTLWCFSGRLQTLVRVFIKSRPAVSYRNERIRTVDGGQISLDWLDNVCSERYNDPVTRPIVLILPGITGNSRQTYVLHMVRQAARHGYRSVVFNNRGFGGEELLTPRTFCAANSEDLERVIDHVRELYPRAPLLAVGVSMGGMILLNYLARKGSEETGIFGALTFSISWNAKESCISLEKPLNLLLFNLHLASNLRKAVYRHREVLQTKVDVDYVLQSRTIREFDERYTSQMFGYESCPDYYHDASPYHKLSQIKVPVLCLNAADDPFSPLHTIPLEMARKLPNVALLVTSHGGHIGFLEGLYPRCENYMDRVFGQFIKAAFEHPGELDKVCEEGQ
uniref:Phospholipase ABHD3 n=1 Tax=Latimeria chalumnae TaxID=7897 RepID=H3B2C2_LATCH